MFAPRLLILSVAICVTALLVPANADSITRSIMSVEDTAEQEYGGSHDPGLVRKGSSDLELGFERTFGYSDEQDTPQRVALLYRDIDIAGGATITGANLQFMVDEPDKTTWFPDNDPEIGDLLPLDTSVTFYGLLDTSKQDLPGASICNAFGQCATDSLYTLTNLTGGMCEGGNCPSFGTGPMGGVGSDIENVTSPVHWDLIPTWTTGDVNGNGMADPGDYESINGTAGPDQRSPNLASIVQEVIDQPDWVSGMSIIFIADPKVVDIDEITGDDILSRGNRTAINFCTPSDSRCVGALDPQPPELMIDFTPPDAGLDGDFDHDGDVDGFDYVLWQRGGSPNPFSAEDLGLWQTNFGATTPLSPLSATSSAVPEPATAMLLLLGMMALVSDSRRRPRGLKA